MQRIKLTFLFLLVCCTLTVLMSGCAKDNLRHEGISGTVTNLTTDEAVSGAKVQLIEEHIPTEPFSPIVRNVIQEVQTDNAGSFEFDPIGKTKRNRTYSVELEKNWYYPEEGWQKGSYEQVVSEVELEGDVPSEIQITSVPMGAIDLLIRNDTDDSVFVHGIFDNGLMQFNVIKSGFGYRTERLIPGFVIPADDYNVTWYLIQDGDTNVLSEIIDVRFAATEPVEFAIE